MAPHVVEGERGDLGGAVAGKHHAIGGDHEIELAPAAVAGLGVCLVIVRQDVGDLHPSTIALDGPLGDLPRALDLFSRRHEGRPVLQSPPVVLGVGELDPVGSEIGRHVDELRRSGRGWPGGARR